MITKLRVFDCFGTLVFVDTQPGFFQAAVNFANRFKCGTSRARALLEPIYLHVACPPSPTINVDAHISLVSPKIGIPESVIYDFMWETFGPPAGWTVPSGATETLDRLKASQATLRLISNSYLPAHQFRAGLHQVGLSPYFDKILVSSEGEGKKPSIEWFGEAFRGDHTSKLMVGDDDIFDISPAAAMGIHTLKITGPTDWNDPVVREQVIGR